MIDLKGKVILITGSAQGIGKEMARFMAEYGAHVIINDVNEQLAQKTAEEIGVISFAADVSDPQQVEEMIHFVLEKYRKIDALVNNAGIIGVKPFEEISYAEWNKMMAVHITGSFLCAQAVLPQMRKQKSGKIVNISSNWGQRGGAGAVHYSTAKAGIIGFTKALARELASDGIQVNAVAPGPIETGMIDVEAEMLGVTADEIRADLTQTIPLGRLGQTRDIAGAVAYLISDLGDFYCGQIISPNGGEVM